MIKINLLAEGKRPTAVRKSKSAELLKGQDIGMWLLGAGLVLGILITAFFWWQLRDEQQAQQEEIARAQAEVEALAAVIKEVEDYKTKKAELEKKIGIINDLKLNQRGPVRVMDHISRALPELLWLDRMVMDDAMITVDGRAFNTNAVANFIEN
ncbi:MAG TPA: PilN domain-containing protein, partial [Thermoanaerobaculia bacterium]|nr:PilN domain-containing protein [Thermoanaerobaculia bacterium]